MSQQTSQQRKRVVRNDRDPIAEYLAALEEFYPAAIGSAQVHKWQDDQVIVSVPLPARVRERMRLFDHMAEVGTRLLLETDQYIILTDSSGRDDEKKGIAEIAD